jgi:phosphonate transport system substrate-binding protein
MKVSRRVAVLGIGSGAAAGLIGCAKPEESGTSPQPSGSSPSAGKGGETVRVAMSAAFVSEAGVHLYKALTDYLGTQTGMPFEFVRGLGYDTINKMLESGAVDVGFVCGLPYVILHDRPQPAANLLAAPVMKDKRYEGKPKYFSDLIVANDSTFQKLEDLKGARFVFNDEISNSGYNLPRYRMAKAGMTTGFFASVARSGSHEESIRMVAGGKADCSYVDSLVLEYDRARNDNAAGRVRVIDSIGPAGIPPVVLTPKRSPEFAVQIQRALLEMHEIPEGRKLLDELMVDRFVKVDDKNYDDIREMRAFAEKAGFDVIR